MIEDIYIGSTTNVVKRRQQHKQRCTNPKCKDYNAHTCQFIRDNGGWDNWSLIAI